MRLSGHNCRRFEKAYVNISLVTEREITRKRRVSPWIPGLFVLGSLTVLVLLQTSNIWKEWSVENASDTLLLYALSSLNFIAFVIFGFIFLRSVTKLMRERRTLQLGAKIKTRLLLYFAAVSLLPIVAMAGFSYLFWNRAIDRWFTQIPENVVRQARDVQNHAIQEQAANLQDTAQMLGSLLESREVTNRDLAQITKAGNLTRIEVIDRENRIVGFSEKPLDPAERPELEKTLAVARNGGESTILKDGRGFDAALWTLADGRKLIIVPNLRADQSVSQMVDDSLSELDRLKDRQFTIRQIGLLTLGVLTFLLIFASSWTAFHIARGLTTPIKALAVGAGEIARGNLSHRVDVFAEDELALLVATFNDMSQRLEENSTELGERRRYIETVLETLPTGVISFDTKNHVGTINRSAVEMLGLEDADVFGRSLADLVNRRDREVLERIVARTNRGGRAAEQAILRREQADGASDSGLPVAISAAALPENGGVVLVIEDLSELIAAQRASAWREVARRMAHEIKNPLTPIQLSAERIAKRFSSTEPVADATGSVVREGTETILREVGSLKSMVDEFSRFARLPEVRLEHENLNEIVEQVIALYEDRLEGAKLESEIGKDIPDTLIDSEQMKRVFVNLIDNAVEAFDDYVPDRKISLRTRFDPARGKLIAEVIDNGRGIAAADFGRLFQPYFSTKSRGTGLGLAIVHRIIVEHGGTIRASSNNGGGARFTIEIPVVS